MIKISRMAESVKGSLLNKIIEELDKSNIKVLKVIKKKKTNTIYVLGKDLDKASELKRKVDTSGTVTICSRI